MMDKLLADFDQQPTPSLLQRGDTQRAKLHHIPLRGILNHYTSKTFVSQHWVNPLAAAAAPLFLLIDKLKQRADYTDIVSLHQNITHEIHAFETQAKLAGYRSDTILVGRYALCALIDETMQQSPWAQRWLPHRLLSLCQGEDWAGERFFFILERISEDPDLHIELLEFMYLCLNRGFQGKYRLAEQDDNELRQVTNQLYRTIRKQRGNVACRLAIGTAQPPKQKIRRRSLASRYLRRLSLLTIAIVISVIVAFNLYYATSSTPLYQQLDNSLSSQQQS